MDKQHFIEDDLIITTKYTMDVLLKQKNPGDLIALYNFYLYTAKWQKTNQVKSTTQYTAQGLGWGVDKVRSKKKKLIELGLIEDIKNTNKESRKVEGWFIKLNFILKRENHPQDFPQGGTVQTVENTETNALRTDIKNSFSKENGEPSNKNIKNMSQIGSVISKFRSNFKQTKQDNRITQGFQHYAHEVVVAAGFENGGRARIFKAFKDKKWGHSQNKKAKEIIKSELFKSLKTEDSKTRYLIASLSK